MPRSSRLQNFICEYNESPKLEKISFIPPFFILILEIILITHAIIENNTFVIILTFILVIISILEIILVAREIHEHYQRSGFDRKLTIRLDDFIIEKNETNVQKIVEDFIDKYPNYKVNRNEIYHIACQIMETHKEELWEKTLENRLKKYIKKSDKIIMKDIIEKFITKYPEYKKNPGKVYQIVSDHIIKNKEKIKK
jgi:hypothetical protein